MDPMGYIHYISYLCLYPDLPVPYIFGAFGSHPPLIFLGVRDDSDDSDDSQGSPLKINMEAKNHLFEKGKSSSKPPFFWGFKMLICRGACFFFEWIIQKHPF